MSRALIASACCIALLVSGCGGSGKSGDRKTACAKASSARYQYRLEGAKVGADFFNRAGDERVIAAAAAYRARVKTLEPLVSDSERGQLEGLVGALAEHEKLLGALAAHNLTAAHKYATLQFEESLDQGQSDFVKICKTSS